MALSDWVQTAALIFFAWQQNRILEQQNVIIANQSERTAMPNKASRFRALVRYWPTGAMVVVMLLTAYDIYARNGAASIIPWWFYATLLLIVATVGLVVGKLAATQGKTAKQMQLDRSFPQTALAQATKKTFDDLPISQKLLVRHIYHHPNTGIAFLSPVLTTMGFPSRVSLDALNAVLVTNLVSHDTQYTFANPAVADIVDMLIDREQWPAIEAIKSITSETTVALQVPRAAPPKTSFVCIALVSIAVAEKTVTRGKTFTIRYLIDSSEAVPDGIWLGASMSGKNVKGFSDGHRDKRVSLFKGRHEYIRDFTIPAGASIGDYTLGANVWHGVVSDSTQSVIVAPGGRAEIAVVA